MNTRFTQQASADLALSGMRSRRRFLQQSGLGLGSVALSCLLQDEAAAVETGPVSLAPRKAPLPAKARHVIHIFAGGAPSHLDTFDPKPALQKYRDQSLPGQSGVGFPSPFQFPKCGRSGLEISEIFPRLGTVADELCVVRSLYTDVPAHGAAAKFIHTGSLTLTRPSLGSWTLYGLGTDNANLPGFITLGGSAEWRQAAFLPSLYQGAKADFAAGRSPDKVLLNLRNEFTSREQQRSQLDLVRQLDDAHRERSPQDEQLEARIESFELAFRMQVEAPEAFDISRESQEVRDLYGKGDLAAKLLCARRLVERGVRFVQVDAGGWDHHTNLAGSIAKSAQSVDQAAAALISDLKSRGLLDSTLVIWGGEFGRTATTAGKVGTDSGRDHHAKCFSIWMAGGGVKGGFAHGATDELGLEVAQDGVHVHDLHATVLRLLGFDHTRLTFRYNGRDFRLTDNFGQVVTPVIASPV